ncbi:hypothetical protein H4582DRAFT_2083660 [Lactarius indigo]|nr:hypothetical protein H4582DRAFT_2083660 [Lactarius indigo]
MLPYAFFDEFLTALTHVHLAHLALPHFVGSPDLVVALTPGRLLHCVTLRIASTLYDGLRPAALFGTLGGVPGNTGTVLEPLERSLDGTSDEVLLQALYKQVGSPLPNFQALRTLPLRAALATEVAKGEEGANSDDADRMSRMEGKAASYTSDKSLGLTSSRLRDADYAAETGQN